MRIICWLTALMLLTFAPCAALGRCVLGKADLERVNQKLSGKIIDYSHNHGADRRIWSAALQQPRDLYVYVPPGYNCTQQYPVLLWLNGFLQDEQAFVHGVVQLLDEAIADGELPPMIIAAPDGSINGRPSYLSAGSFYVNSEAGNFEDYIIQDVWPFVLSHFPIRSEREAHAIAGVSMGGFGAFNLAIKYSDQFKVVIGVFPPLNLRWVDCHGRYRADFDPCCWGWRTELDRGREVIGRFYGGLITVRLKRVLDPLYDRSPGALESVKRENPIEMIDAYHLQPGMLDMYVAYAGEDQYNIDAQVESFLYRARQRGLDVTVGYEPKGRHNLRTAKKLFPGVVAWLAPLLAPYSPGQTPDLNAVGSPVP